MGTPRRELIWATITEQVTFSANGTYVNLDLLTGYKGIQGADTAGVTIMRCLGFVVPQSPANGDSWYLGFRVGDLKQTTAAPAAVSALNPNPRDDPYTNWRFLARAEHDSAFNLGYGSSTYQGIHFDIKSKSRMHLVQQAWFASIVQDSVGTPAKTYTVFARTLLALS
jgi:hypothetical protein